MYSDTLGVSTWGGDDAIWEFAVGDCAMAAHQEDIDAVYNIPWVPLPDEVSFTLVNERPASYFNLKDLTVLSGVQVGEFTDGADLNAWCGNDTLWIHWNDTYKANVYPYFDVPSSSIYASITDEQWAMLNWIANNKVPTTSSSAMNAVQKAIWWILNQPAGVHNSVAVEAEGHADYKVPLGGYIVVLVDPYENVTHPNGYENSDYSEAPGIQLTLVRFDP